MSDFYEFELIRRGGEQSPDAYMRKLQGLVNAGALKIAEVAAVTVRHDDGCPYLNQDGHCSCDAFIFNAKGERIA